MNQTFSFLQSLTDPPWSREVETGQLRPLSMRELDLENFLRSSLQQLVSYIVAATRSSSQQPNMWTACSSGDVRSRVSAGLSKRSFSGNAFEDC